MTLLIKPNFRSQQSFSCAAMFLLGLSLSSSQVYANDAIKQFKGADLVKFEQGVQQDYSIPLANLKKSARTWIPIESKQVQGDTSSSLYKFGRNESLKPIFNFYKEQMAQDTNDILYECHGRTCGSSNAWANNFFNDYRLYGADANQSLLVVANESNAQYQVLYLNRRGAGDVMLRLDTVNVKANKEKAEILFQASLNDKIAIRHYLDAINDGQAVFALLSSNKSIPVSRAFSHIEAEIKDIKLTLDQSYSDKITFINLGNQAPDFYGENQISVLVNDDDYVSP